MPSAASLYAIIVGGTFQLAGGNIDFENQNQVAEGGRDFGVQAAALLPPAPNTSTYSPNNSFALKTTLESDNDVWVKRQKQMAADLQQATNTRTDALTKRVYELEEQLRHLQLQYPFPPPIRGATLGHSTPS